MGLQFGVARRRFLAAAAVGAVAASGAVAIVSSTSAQAARVDNPYQGAKVYVNPEWAAKAKADGGSSIATQPTGVWIDRIAAIEGAESESNGAMGVAAHLDEAVSQGATAIQFIVYDLPGRDCAALASQGELGATEIDRYQSEYIDPIAAIQTDAKYANLRIINIIEIDSLPNLITNVGSRETATANCDTMLANGNYQKGISYALTKLKADNIYNYIDAGHHGWLGWDDNFKPAAKMIADVAKQGGNNVSGLIVNTANYGATTEPYLKLTEANRKTKWIDWNRYVDEQTFGVAFVKEAISAGMPSNSGLLIDTSRNGWGGPDRPKAATAGDTDAAVDASRIDRRIHLGNWCNQKGAGIGERPKAAPSSGVHAFVWIKPPGESDGSDSQTTGNKGIDQMCDPAYEGNPRNANNKTSALGNSPVSGSWFSEHFQTLLKNAYPAL